MKRNSPFIFILDKIKMDKKEIKVKMGTLMKTAKILIKESSKRIAGLKKKDRETDDYKANLSRSMDVIREALRLLDEYKSLSQQLEAKRDN